MTDPTAAGGDPIPPATTPQYPAAPPVASSHAVVGNWQVTDPTSQAQPVATPVAPAGPSGGGGRRWVAVVVALALVAGGTYATTQLLADEAGAGSPEEAGERLLAAVTRSDLLGIIELLPPGERQVLADITSELSDQADRLGIVDETFRLDGFPGLTIDIEDPEFEVQELGDGLARVSLVDGQATIELDGEQVAGSLGEVVEEIAEANDVEIEVEDSDGSTDIGEIADEAAEDAELDGGEVLNPFTVAVVEQDGRWFPSLGFTIAEFARMDMDQFGDGPSAPDLDDGIEPDGAESPEAALQALLDAAVEADAEAALAVLDPGDAGAMQVYADVFFDFGSPEDTGLVAEITDAQVTPLGGGVHRVLPTGFVVEGEIDGGSMAFELEDGCATFELVSDEDPDENVDFESCADGELAEDLAEGFEDVEVPEEIDELIEAFSPVEVGIITVEHDGEHFVSWLRTLVDFASVTFRGLEREDLEEGGIVFELLTGELNDEFEEFFDAAFEDLGFEEEFEDGFDFDEEFEFDDFELPPLDATGTAGSGPNGELLLGDVIPGAFGPGEVAEFQLIGDSLGSFIGAQATDLADLTITVTDVATGEELGFADDTFGFDPEVALFLEPGQLVVVRVAAFADSGAGEFLVYYLG
jgi:hypothetical protein